MRFSDSFRKPFSEVDSHLRNTRDAHRPGLYRASEVCVVEFEKPVDVDDDRAGAGREAEADVG